MLAYSTSLCPTLHQWTETQEYKTFLEKAKESFAQMHLSLSNEQYSMLNIAYETDDFALFEKTAEQWQKRFKTLIILGTGGSSLGAQTLCALTQSSFNESKSCQVLFIDNIDSNTFSSLLSSLNFSETGFLVVSKSGSTPETLAQLLSVIPCYPSPHLKEHVFVLTELRLSPLRQIAEHYDLECFEHNPSIGGRFSVFSNVGLLPAATAGINIRLLRQGACQVLQNPQFALEGAALAAMAPRKGYTQSVVMPYSDRLYYFTFWFRQLWAESLGKKGLGTTPINALGTVDQHSQLQLYLDGPKDKLFTFMCIDRKNKGPKLIAPSHLTSLDFLSHKTMGDLMEAEQKATSETLIKRGRPVRIFYLSELQEQEMGALLMHYLLETIITAKILGLDAFDQPAVEEGKILTRNYLEST